MRGRRSLGSLAFNMSLREWSTGFWMGILGDIGIAAPSRFSIIPELLIPNRKQSSSPIADRTLYEVEVALMGDQLRARDVLQRDRVVGGVGDDSIAGAVVMGCRE